jgi:transcriptional regulator with XRE-family HTH domain
MRAVLLSPRTEPGVSYAYISRIERDARRPGEKALRELAATLLETGNAEGVCPHCGRPREEL